VTSATDRRFDQLAELEPPPVRMNCSSRSTIAARFGQLASRLPRPAVGPIHTAFAANNSERRDVACVKALKAWCQLRTVGHHVSGERIFGLTEQLRRSEFACVSLEIRQQRPSLFESRPQPRLGAALMRSPW
jgi:hypothetical protein